MMKYTGEQRGEIFVGNTAAKSGIPEHLRSLPTIRLGEQALDIEGLPLDPDYMLPMFIGTTDSARYEQVMMKRYTETVRGAKTNKEV